MHRKEKLEIPQVAFREALLNLLIHRNYHLPSPSKIAIYDDRIEIFSPGDFYGPIKPDDYLKGMTYLRNPAICKVFRELGLVEKMGTGFLNIFLSYEEWGLPTPQIIEGENFIKCVLSRQKVERGHRDEEKILALFHLQDEITLSDVMDKCAISRSTAQRWLHALIEAGAIERLGQTRNVRYRRR